MLSASRRLASVLRDARWMPRGAGVQLESYSNEVWLFEDVVVRICGRGDRQRLIREAAVLRALANRVACPEVLAEGSDQALSWMLTRRLPGQPLRSVWPHLDRRARRTAVQALGHALRVLHETTFDAATRELLVTRDPSAQTDPEAIVGADLNPLPIARVLRLLPAARRLHGVDVGLIDEAQALLGHLADAFPAELPSPVVHGDAHLDNLLWQPGGSVALLDFEWVRPGPADLELEAFLRFENELAPEEARLYRELPAWLYGAYPGLFAHPHLDRRLRLYELAFCLRHLLVWPRSMPASLPTGHPYRRLARVVAGSSPPRAWLEPRRDTS